MTPEVQLTSEPLRVDDVIEVWADRVRDLSDTGETLRGMWRYVIEVALLEFKSTAWPLQRGDLYRLIAYGMLWLTGHPRRAREGDSARSERLSAHEVTLLLAVPSINTALREELDDLGMALPESDDGYHLITGALVPLVIIDLGAVAEREDDDVLRAFAGRPSRTLAAHRWMRQHQTLRSDTMSTRATPELEGYDDFVAFMLDGLSPEERMMGLKPEQRLAGLAPQERLAGLAPQERLAGLAPQERLAGLPPEQRLAGLAPERAALAFPTEALRALSAEYIATLPGDVQAEIRARLAR